MEKPSDIIYFLIQNFGGMNVKPGATHMKWRKTYAVLVTGGVLIYATSSFIFMFGEANFVSRLESVQFSITAVHITVRHMNIVFRGKFIKEMVDRLDVAWEDAKSENLLPDEFVKSEKVIWFFFRWCFIVFVSACPFKIFECVFKNWGKDISEWETPFYIWTPFPITWFWTRCIYQSSSLVCGFISVSTSAILLFTVAEFVVLQMKVLQYNITTRTRTNSYKTKPYQRHQRILESVRDINKLLSAVYFLEMLINSVEAAVRLYGISVVLQNSDISNIVSYCVFAILTLVTPFIACFCGNKVTAQNELLFKDAYQNAWYTEDVKTRRELLILTSMATKPVILHYRYLLTFGMEQFTKFCQAVYSYIMVLNFFGSIQ